MCGFFRFLEPFATRGGIWPCHLNLTQSERGLQLQAKKTQVARTGQPFLSGDHRSRRADPCAQPGSFSLATGGLSRSGSDSDDRAKSRRGSQTARGNGRNRTFKGFRAYRTEGQCCATSKQPLGFANLDRNSLSFTENSRSPAPCPCRR